MPAAEAHWSTTMSWHQWQAASSSEDAQRWRHSLVNQPIVADSGRASIDIRSICRGTLATKRNSSLETLVIKPSWLPVENVRPYRHQSSDTEGTIMNILSFRYSLHRLSSEVSSLVIPPSQQASHRGHPSFPPLVNVQKHRHTVSNQP
jgi:hypothetical protein